jgi:hypothetical protein
MNVVTRYPILVDPTSTVVNNYSIDSQNNKELEGRIQNVSVGDILVKGTNPVFNGDYEVTRNEFMYQTPINTEKEVLTPMDEFLYSEKNYSQGDLDLLRHPNYDGAFSSANGLPNPFAKPNPLSAGLPTGTIAITPSQYASAVQNIPNGPTAQQQLDKAKKEGKFWNSLKGGFESFSKSENGQIILNSGTSYIASKLGATVPTTTDGTTPSADVPTPDKTPMSKTTKTVLIVGGVAVVALIIYSIAKGK